MGISMNSIEFLKKFGIAVAKDLAYRDKTSIGYLSVEHHSLNQDDLKQIVEAFEIIGLFKNLDHAKVELLACETAMHSQILVKLDVGMGYIDTSRVKKSINLVEQCQ